MKHAVFVVAVLAAVGLARADIQPITGFNAVGFAAVNAPGGANTIITVPFEQCFGQGWSGALNDLVATNGLTSHASDPAQADQLVVLTTNETGLVYYYYYCRTGQGWIAITTEQIMPDGSTQTLSPPAANDFFVARGLGFWIKRVASAGSTVYVKGQVATAKQATDIQPGLNLVGYSALAPFTLNGSGIDWTGANGANGISSETDKILVCNGDGSFSTYYYFIKRAGSSSYYDQFTNQWVESTSTGPALPSRTLSAGQGFWYHRRGAGSFEFHPDGQ